MSGRVALKGKVISKKEGISEVWVWNKTDDIAVKTDGEGLYLFEELMPGVKEIVIWKKGYISTFFTDFLLSGEYVRDVILEERKVQEDEISFLTYTCPISDKTYAGYPNFGQFIDFKTDVLRACQIIHDIARRNGQPVTWVINDQEYTNQQGLLPYLKKWQGEGDAIVVTLELITKPPEVDLRDTKRILRWIDKKCKEVGLAIDGLWSIKFYESDLRAILELPAEEFPWTRNLAGSAWHQYGIDDSTWGGCPYQPYYPALNNIKGASNPSENGDILMLEWLSRDINAILRGGNPAVFSLDPADPNRVKAGGFWNEEEALEYSLRLMEELVKQKGSNETNIIDINEEARGWFSEGHEKTYMLGNMLSYGHRELAEKVVQASYKDIWRIFRERHKETPERLYVIGNLDYRQLDEDSILFENEEVQMCFLESKGMLPIKLWDYTKRYPGGDNIPYPQEDLGNIELIEYNVDYGDDTIIISALINSDLSLKNFGISFWDLDLPDRYEVLDKTDNIYQLKRGLYEHAFLHTKLERGENVYEIRLALSEEGEEIL